jgi:hypothetical protein
MTTIPVYFEEHEDSPIEGGSRTGEFDFARIFLCRWTERFEFLRGMFTGGFFGLPMSYSAEWPGLIADKYKIERLVNKPTSSVPYISEPISQQLQHDAIAKITINYSPITPEQAENNEGLPDGTWVTYSQSDSVEFVTIPGRSLKWETSGKVLPPDVNPVTPQNQVRHEVTWHQVLNPPWTVISALKGKVNSIAFRIPGSGQIAFPETVMLIESTAKIALNIASETRWELSLVFAEKAIKNLTSGRTGAISGTDVYGWNHQWDPQEGIYDRPLTDEGLPMFDSAEMATLFTS